ncbi:Xaa-Pro aminopeptidase 2 [Aix galericulata]|nr:Xaa-Pro aminopeptidase 2 [Aix galericulata]
MGNIDLSRLVFPPNTAGRNVEAFARRALWDVGLNYGHGTGHGIGNFLSSNNVPLAAGMFTSIGRCPRRGAGQLEEMVRGCAKGPKILPCWGASPGLSMGWGGGCWGLALCWALLLSSEPGYYRDGEFGIRIEDIALVVEAQTKHPTGEEPFLTFEVVSLVPYDRNLIDVSLLSQEQIKYLNAYYETIRARVGPELQRQQLEEEYRWLQRNTEPFPLASTATAAAARLGTLAIGSLLSVLLAGLQA